jgi:hypothetical protein
MVMGCPPVDPRLIRQLTLLCKLIERKAHWKANGLHDLADGATDAICALADSAARLMANAGD